jgi:hypothetical protein
MKIHAIENQKDWDAVVKASGSDGHYPHAATHYFTKDDEIVGAFNVGPFVNWWMKTDKKLPDTLRALIKAQRALKAAKVLNPVWMVSNDSPYLPYLERLGFTDASIELRYYHQTKEAENVFQQYA